MGIELCVERRGNVRERDVRLAGLLMSKSDIYFFCAFPPVSLQLEPLLLSAIFSIGQVRGGKVPGKFRIWFYLKQQTLISKQKKNPRFFVP